MNTKKFSLKLYEALSLLILVMMGLVGCGTLGAGTEAAKPMDEKLPDAEIVEIINTELEPEIESDASISNASDQLIPVSEATPEISDAAAIRTSLAAHFGLDESDFTRFVIEENTGMYARGGVAANDGGGYFLVAKVDGEWVFVDGGQTWPNCSEVARYGFPASMVPECPAGGSNAPDCPGLGTTVATFIADVNYPDGAKVSPGQTFVKTWRVQNVGTCTWDADYQLVFDNGDRMGGSVSQQLANGHIPPGATVDISVQLTAPDEPGTYHGDWKFRDPNGNTFGLTTGNPIWVEIEVEDEDSLSSNLGYPIIEIVDVDEDETVTIMGANFPPNDTFIVLLNQNGTLGIEGTLVATTTTGADGEFTDTYSIPASLQGENVIAIHLESPTSGYYAYSWFAN